MKKKKEITKEEIKTVTKTYSLEEARAYLIDLAKLNGNNDDAVFRFGENDLPKIIGGKIEEEKELPRHEFNKRVTALLMALETESHFGIVGSFDEDYRPLAKELSNQIIKEYQCETHAEKILAEIAVQDFIRTIDNSKRFNNCINGGGYISEDRTKYLAMLSKQIDRAHRQFLTALLTLKQMKTPMIEMNIKTKNAFISQNQQINVEKQNNEINNPI